MALFYYQAKKWIGFLAAALGGLNTLVFAGSLVENNPPNRAGFCVGLGFPGIDLNDTWNTENADVISARAVASPCASFARMKN